MERDVAERAAALVSQKNHWLSSHVDVPYPTPESITGRELYHKSVAHHVNQQVSAVDELVCPLCDAIYLVDFHRLTVMFARLQASQWHDEQQQAAILEFFAQITISSDNPIYIGFKSGEPVACALVTALDDLLLVSDIVSIVDEPNADDRFIGQLIALLELDRNLTEVVCCR